MILPKLLRKTTNGRIFAYTEALARRADMVPVWPDDVNPNLPGKPMTGLQIDASREAQISASFADKDRIMAKMQVQIDDLLAQNQGLNEEIVKLNTTIRNITAAAPPVEVPDAGRLAKIREGIAKILAENSPNSFTGAGKIRIEPLEEACGVSDITAAERDTAMEMQ